MVSLEATTGLQQGCLLCKMGWGECQGLGKDRKVGGMVAVWKPAFRMRMGEREGQGLGKDRKVAAFDKWIG